MYVDIVISNAFNFNYFFKKNSYPLRHMWSYVYALHKMSLRVTTSIYKDFYDALILFTC